MVLYFSGTGNSEYAAKMTAEILEDTAVSITEKIKKRNAKEISSQTPLFYAFFVRDGKFYATDECVGCSKCARVCPLNNIKITDGRPVWNKKCTHCMACISSCPKEAIEYGKASKGKPRYRCPM